MPPTKKNKKGSRRGNPAARAAQSRPRPAGTGASAGAAPAGAPPGSAQAQNVPPGLTSAKPAAPASARPAAPAAERPARVMAPSRSRGTAEAERAPAAAEPETTPADPADDVPKWAAKAVEELLTPTYWLDPGESGEPFSATIRFSGRRTDVTGKPQPRDSFWQEETVDKIIPGSGPVAITAEVRGIIPGDWTVTARSVVRTGGRSYRSYPPPGHDPAGMYRVPPPRRVEIPAEATATVHTSSLLRSKVPGIVRFAYATLVGLGVLVGLGLEALLL